MSDDVPNPLLSAIDGLITRTETAVSETPHIDGPTESIGPGPAWTGATARAVHDDHLAPHAEAVKTSLNHLVQDVEDAKGDIDPMVSEGVARAIRYELQMR
jgi:hypothetical protein